MEMVRSTLVLIMIFYDEYNIDSDVKSNLF